MMQSRLIYNLIKRATNAASALQ